MDALVVSRTGQVEGANSGADMRTCIASLQAMGIRTKMAVAENMPSDAYVNTFDFLVIPSCTNAVFGNVLDDSGITIPMMLLGVGIGAAGLGSTPGVTSTRSALEDDFYTFPWSSQEYFAAYGGSYTLTTGTALMTVSATEPSGTGGAAQANTGRVAMWSSPTAGGSTSYFCSLFPTNHPMLPFLVQAAIDDGLLSPTPLKAPLCVDIDHINDEQANLDETILDKIASYVPAGGVIHAGIWNGSVAYFDNMTAALNAKLVQYSGKPFKYNWHDHVFSPIIGANLDSEGYSTDHTKTQIDTQYQADKAVWEGLGLELHTPAHNNPGSDSWDEATLELMSQDVSKTSSPANDTSQAGYGFRTFRGTPSNNSRASEAKTSVYHNYLHTKRKIRGMQYLPAWDLALNADMPYNSRVDWRNNFNYITRAISNCFILYMHNEDFIAADQAPGTTGKQHGYVQMQMIADVGKYLSGVCEPFADITKRINITNAA